MQKITNMDLINFLAAMIYGVQVVAGSHGVSLIRAWCFSEKLAGSYDMSKYFPTIMFCDE